MTTWTIAVDWDRSGDFSGTYDDVTSRVVSAKWFLGTRRPYADTADNSTLTMVLTNDDRRYSPEYSSGPLSGKLAPYRRVKIESNDGSTTRTHWIGWIERIQPAVNQHGQRTVTITAQGVMQFYKAAETHLEIQENQRADQIIEALIKEVVIPPALTAAWIIGRIGNSELDDTTRLANTTGYSELDTGLTTFAIAGDNWIHQGGPSGQREDTFNVYRAIWDVTAAERGRFYFSREGKALFWNRHHLLDEVANAATFNDTMQDLVYIYAGADEFHNEIIVVCHPRAHSATADETLWELAGTVRIDPGDTREMVAKYQDASGWRLSGKNISSSGATFSQGSATITLKERATGAEVSLSNTGSTPAYLTGLTIQGEKISDAGQMEASAIDQDSIVDYGRRTLRLNLPALDNLEDAEQIATYEVNRRSQPRGAVRSITLKSHAKNGGGHHAQQLARTLGDHITIQETQTDHDSGYFIIGEMHALEDDLLVTSWLLEPAPATYPWKLGAVGRSELGEATYPTY